MATGDINGDGKLDLVVANEGDNTFSVLLGNGDGTFQVRTNTPTGHVPTWAALGDVNGDGQLDVAIPNFQDASVSFFIQEAVATVSVTSLTFGNQIVGTTSAAQSVTLTNSGSAPLSITSIAASGDFAVTNNTCPASLAAAASCTFGVTFTPTATGARTGAITTHRQRQSPHSDHYPERHRRDSHCHLSATSLTFGNQLVGTTSSAQTVTLTNTGTATMTITSIVATGDFALTGNTCGATLAVSASCTFGVTFTPTTSGARTGAITLTDNASPSTQTITLNGTGVIPIATLSASSLTFGNQLVGTTSIAQTVTLTNTGTATLTITSIVPSGDFARVCFARWHHSGASGRSNTARLTSRLQCASRDQ